VPPSQTPSDFEFARWEKQQLEDRTRQSELFSDPLDMWSSTLKHLVSEHRQLHTKVEASMAQIADAQSTIELWEAVARFHGLDYLAIASEALAEARTAAVESAHGDSAEHSMLLAGAARDVTRAETDGSAATFVGLIDPAHASAFESMLRKVSRRTVKPQFFDTERPLIGRDGSKVERMVFVIPLLGTELPRRVMAVLESYDTVVLRDDDPEAQDAILHRNRGVVKSQIRKLLAVRSAQLNNLAAFRRGLADEQQSRAADVELYRRAILRRRAVAFTVTKFSRSMAARGRADTGGLSGGGGGAAMTSDYLRAEGWVLASRVTEVSGAVARCGGHLEAVSEEETDAMGLVPPTHFPLNEFMAPFQSIVDTYSVPRYREINPAIFTAATFPFLFGIMYGDVGHATVVTLASIFIVFSRGMPGWFARCLRCGRPAPHGAPKPEPAAAAGSDDFIMESVWFARYVLVLMGACGIYMGFVYNDCFSMGLNLYGTRYTVPEASSPNSTAARYATKVSLTDDVYPFGFDPVWHESSNQLMYFNSLKMKMAIVIAVVHMTFGLFLRVANDWHFAFHAPTPLKRSVAWVKIWLEDIPMIVVLQCLFGYMTFLIFLKWATDWSAPGAGQPPSLVDTMIGMALSPGAVKDPMYPYQALVQGVLMIAIGVLVPVILLGVPLYERCLHRAKAASHHHLGDAAEGVFGLPDGGDGVPLQSRAGGNGAEDVRRPLAAHADYHSDAEHGLHEPAAGREDAHVADPAAGGGHSFDFGALMVHQGIETVEFVLSTISHTASYLRLWALSLAHSQLSEVFWDKAFRATVEMEFAPAILVGFAIWLAATVGILCMMDVLECYLHSLRLHWVEFNSKFYHGEGIKFAPLSFKAVIEDDAASG